MKLSVRRISQMLSFAAFVVLVVVALTSESGSSHIEPLVSDPIVRVTMLDVGQGDAFHIRTPDGVDMLIDGGRDMSVLEGLGQSLPFSDRQVEFLVLTHPDADHVTGLVHVLERYDVGRVLQTGVASSSDVYRAFAEETERVPHDTVRAGDRIDLAPDVHAQVLFPTEQYLHGEHDKNDTSTVIRLDAGSRSFLFVGDLERPGEEALLSFLGEGTEVLDTDVLQVGHHGSVTSSSDAFLDAVTPEIGLISTGFENSYGHPHARTLSTLSARGVDIFRTDQDGPIVCETDGAELVCESAL